jgi:hypothetical protein
MQQLQSLFTSRTSKVVFVSTGLTVGSAAMADIALLTSAVTAKISEAETFGYAILAIGLVAIIGMALVKRFAKAGAN